MKSLASVATGFWTNEYKTIDSQPLPTPPQKLYQIMSDIILSQYTAMFRHDNFELLSNTIILSRQGRVWLQHDCALFPFPIRIITTRLPTYQNRKTIALRSLFTRWNHNTIVYHTIYNVYRYYVFIYLQHKIIYTMHIFDNFHIIYALNNLLAINSQFSLPIITGLGQTTNYHCWLG